MRRAPRPLSPHPPYGLALSYVMAAVALMAVAGIAATSLYFPQIKNSGKTGRQAATLALVTQAVYVLSDEANDSDGDGVHETTAPLSAGSAPAGGGQVPAASRAPRRDAWRRALGYCAWNNGSSNAAGGTVLGGDGGGVVGLTSSVLAIVSAGADGAFQSTCTNLKAGTVSGDDIALVQSIGQVRGNVDGTLYYGEPVANAAALPTVGIPAGQVRLVLATGELVSFDGSVWAVLGGGGGGGGSGAGANNLLINSNFDLWERGTAFSPSVTAAAAWTYAADMWRVRLDSGAGETLSATLSRQAYTGAAGEPAEGHYYLRVAPSGASTRAHPVIIDQPVENARLLSGQTVTYSFYARAASPVTAEVWLYHRLSASSIAESSKGSVAIGTAWARHSVTFTVTAGHTGTDNQPYRSHFAAQLRLPSLVQVDFGQAQLEEGPAMTPYAARPAAWDQAAALRYFERGSVRTSLFNSSTGSIFIPVRFRGRKREDIAAGDITFTSNTSQAQDGVPASLTLGTLSVSPDGFNQAFSGHTAGKMYNYNFDWQVDRAFYN